MNEQIREILSRCQLESIDGPEYPRWTDLEKFAELIVKECAEVAWLYTPDTEELEYSHLIKDKILKRFGVE